MLVLSLIVKVYDAYGSISGSDWPTTLSLMGKLAHTPMPRLPESNSIVGSKEGPPRRTPRNMYCDATAGVKVQDELGGAGSGTTAGAGAGVGVAAVWPWTDNAPRRRAAQVRTTLVFWVMVWFGGGARP